MTQKVKSDRGVMEENMGVYANADTLRGDQLSGAGGPERSLSRAAAVCLGLLCALLLAGIIALGFCFTRVNEDKNIKMERDQLQTRYTDMTRERDELKRRLCESGEYGWRRFTSSCYYFSTEKKSWEESRKDCIRRGAYLVIINSREEMEFVHTTTINLGSFWLGLTDNVPPTFYHQWTWVDGTLLDPDKTYWATGEPNLSRFFGPSCVERWLPNQPANRSLADTPCHHNLYYVCEM
ncbi:C-type lectin domain family 4 member E-like [Osmerus mordax]|uniref:C-type lectin domain family 4 member E-like n=1 Tax=Osmerus mordax TaxID=8014 RepID=UPI00350EC6A3